MLCRSVDIEATGEILPMLSVSQTAAINGVLSLLGNVGPEGLEVEFVAAPAEFVGVVILDVEFTVVVEAIIGVDAESVGVEFSDLGETVAVVVVRVAAAVGFVECHAVAPVRVDDVGVG